MKVNIMKQNTVRLTEADLKNVIAESVKKVLKEIGDTPRGYTYGSRKGMAESSKIQLKEDLFPDGIDITPARTAWEGISNALVNIQQYMDLKKSEFNREHELEQGVLKDIGNEDVEELVNYIHLTLNNVLKSTLPDLMK